MSEFSRDDKILALKDTFIRSDVKIGVHNCSFCDYLCGYISKENKIFYDSGCNCIKSNYKDLRKVNTEEFLKYIDENLTKVEILLRNSLN